MMPDWKDATNGKYQVLAAFLLCCIQLCITFSDQFLHIYGWTPPHRCRLPPQNDSQLSHALWWPVVEKGGRKVFSSCSMYLDPLDHSVGVQPCIHGWEYFQNYEEGEWSLATEWDLVCEKQYLMNLLPYVHTAGAMLGGVVFGALADRYGRRFNLLAALFLHTILSLAMHFLATFSLFAVAYSLQGVLVTAIQCISYALVLETLPFQSHLLVTICLGLVISIGTIILSVVSWLIKNWRYTQLAISAPGIVCLGYFWLIPRSLPWLMVEGYVHEAEKQLIHFAKFNKTTLPYNFRFRIINYCKKLRSYSSSHSMGTVVSSNICRRYVFILYYMWFVIALETDSSYLPALKGNQYALLFVKGLIDTGIIIILFFFAQRFGPRSAHACVLVFGGISCTASALLSYTPFFKSVSHIVFFVSPILAVVGKSCIRSAIVTCTFFTLKVFPTGVRCIGLGSCLFWFRTARLMGFSLLELENVYNFPLALYGFLAVIGGCLSSFLPSDCHRPLPNVALEVEKSFTIDSSSRGMRCRSLLADHVMSPIDLEKTTDTLLELRVQEFQNMRLINESRETVAMSEEQNRTFDRRRDIEEDADSRLTDLEDELCRIWEVNSVAEGNNHHRSTKGEHHNGGIDSDTRLNETRF
ncbi:organic anion transporter 3 [Parasteatoda tepidariorum]|uniref:organic anion transporter 3 n=1 Tax=Parasteatoda tepidariorum TaxID=114398 RepID=UPI00077FD7A0|nr:solute carrier family 22 member 8 [Parasteatoda tepidariorum]